MNIENKLDIVIITYNRQNELDKTLKQILDEKSPVKNCSITVLNNASSDNTVEIVKQYQNEYKNLFLVNNFRNIGGNANIAKAFSEFSKKDYIWVLCDNDFYYWKNWDEVIQKIDENYDVIMTRACKNLEEIYYSATLVSGAIYKTSNITQTVVENMYSYIHTLFPHLAIIAKNINDNNKIYMIDDNLVEVGLNAGYKTVTTRGLKTDDLPEWRKEISWDIGCYQTLDLIKDKNLRKKIIKNTTYFHTNLFERFVSIVVRNKFLYNNSFNNYRKIINYFSFFQKILFILAYLKVNFTFLDYRFYNLQTFEEWEDYFKKVNEEKYLEKLSKKLKNKKVLIYGAGLLTDVLNKNYDLKKFNIIAIADKKFEKYNDDYFRGIKVIKPENIKNADFDVILFSLKLYKNIEKSLKQKGIKKESYSLIKKSFKYIIRN